MRVGETPYEGGGESGKKGGEGEKELGQIAGCFLAIHIEKGCFGVKEGTGPTSLRRKRPS